MSAEMDVIRTERIMIGDPFRELLESCKSGLLRDIFEIMAGPKQPHYDNIVYKVNAALSRTLYSVDRGRTFGYAHDSLTMPVMICDVIPRLMKGMDISSTDYAIEKYHLRQAIEDLKRLDDHLMEFDPLYDHSLSQLEYAVNQ